MTSPVTPFLMFEGRAEEALELYVSVLPDSRIVEIERYGPDGPGPAGSVKLASASLSGQIVMASDSYVKHAFGFTPSLSLFVSCASETELDRIAAALGQRGEVLMPTADYGFSRRFTWLNDRFGVSWQLNLP